MEAKREPDFSGWATKNDIVCADGAIIRTNAFAHQDTTEVPLVWQHRHNEMENIIGHARLENRPDGVYTFAYFNDNPKAKLAKELVRHGDIKSMSIWANQLTKIGNEVRRGEIREVSLVPAGANPGAVIDSVYIRHGYDLDIVPGEAIIYTGLELIHSDSKEKTKVMTDENSGASNETSSEENERPTVKEVYDTLNEDQEELLEYFVEKAISETKKELAELSHSDSAPEYDEDKFLEHVDQKLKEGFNTMANIFEQSGQVLDGASKDVGLSHSQMTTIFEDAKRNGSLKDAILAHADEYGITDINMLFPDAKSLTTTPEFIKRRTEWVSAVLGGARAIPFARVKTIFADITADEARARGYVKGTKKKDEVIRLLKRVTSPTTIYKKQKLDRDDVVDITSFDVVSWLKGEMRLMLEEELARAILFGDGREADHEDKIDQERIRPIAWDDEMYTTRVNISSGLTATSMIDTIIASRKHYKGVGNPVGFTTEDVLVDMLLAKDKMGRDLYTDKSALLAKLRLKDLITVEAMETYPELVFIMVNLDDYTIGADKGGEMNMFDDFDIDYNQQKYLIETRVSGALTRPKAAVVITRTAASVVVPVAPTFDDATDTITIPVVTGVEYLIDDLVVTGDQVIEAVTDVVARAASGYSLQVGVVKDWTFAPTGA